MATTRVVAGDKEVITNTETTVTSALVSHVRIFLPAIGDGSGATVAAGVSITCSHTVNAGSLTVLDNQGRRVLVLDGGSKVQLIAQGDATDNLWVVSSEIAKNLPARALAVNGTLLPAMNSEIVFTKAFNFANLIADGAATSTHTVTGAAIGDEVVVTFDQTLVSTQLIAHVSAPDTVQIIHRNYNTSSAVDLPAGTLRFVIKTAVGILPAGASLDISGWMKVLKPDGTVGLVPFWDEIA